MGPGISILSRMRGEWGLCHSRIIMLGLDSAGKTTVLYKLKNFETISTIPTIGFNVEEVKVNDLCFTLWDVGGGKEKMRPLWRQYYLNSDALIFVVDSSDQERLEEAAKELHIILSDPGMCEVSLLVFANKQDLPGAATPSELADKLRLRDLEHHRNKWNVQPCSAVTGDGLNEGLEIVANMTREHKKATGYLACGNCQLY